MQDAIVILILAAVLGAAVWYIVQAKKKGRKCIGCPDSGCACQSGGCSGCSGCGGSCQQNQ